MFLPLLIASVKVYVAKEPSLARGFASSWGAEGKVNPSLLLCAVLDDATQLQKKDRYTAGRFEVEQESASIKHAGDAMVVKREDHVLPLYKVTLKPHGGNIPTEVVGVLPSHNFDPQLREKMAKEAAAQYAEDGNADLEKMIFNDRKKERELHRKNVRARTARALASTTREEAEGGGSALDMSQPQASDPANRKAHRKQMRRRKQQLAKEREAKAGLQAARAAGLHTAGDRQRAAAVAKALAKRKKGKSVAGVSGSKARGHAGAGGAAEKYLKYHQKQTKKKGLQHTV